MDLWRNQICKQLGKNWGNACNSQLLTKPMKNQSLNVLCIDRLTKKESFQKNKK